MSDLWPAVWRLRAELRGVLADLDDREWVSPSACPGWRVCDVAAHVISSPQARPPALLAALVRAGGSFDRCIRDEAVRAGARGRERILADFVRYDGSRAHPVGTTEVDPLLDVLVHTQDIVRPLGRTTPMPVAESAEVASYLWDKRFPFRARRRFRGLSLRATDTEWQAGEGPEVVGPVGDLVLLLTGRTPALGALGGPGAPEAGRRLTS